MKMFMIVLETFEFPGDIIDELCQMHESRENYYDEYFRLRTVEMIERDFKRKLHKDSGKINNSSLEINSLDPSISQVLHDFCTDS